MSQDKTLPPTSLASRNDAPGSGVINLEGLEANPEALVRSYADNLITSLFEEVDRLLEGDSETLERVNASLALAPTAEENLSVSPEPTSTGPAPTLDGGSDALALLAAEAEAQDSALTLVPPQGRSALGRLLDRLLLLSTGLSLTGLAAVLWINHHQPLTVPTSTSEAVNAEFLQYLQRSLQVIDKKTNLAAQTPPPPSQTSAQIPSLSLLPLPGSGSTLGGPINVIERVYIPYQTTQPTLPQPARPAGPSLAQADPAPVSSPTPAVVHRLVGVLELGDRSAALFEVNGVPQRVYIGERIGTAGWTLVSVAHQEVVVRRNGDVRSLYIGQQF